MLKICESMLFIGSTKHNAFLRNFVISVTVTTLKLSGMLMSDGSTQKKLLSIAAL